MPIYEYTCTTCGADFERIVSSADAAPACQTCGSRQVEKQLSTFSPAVAGTASPCADMGCGKAGTGCASSGCPSTFS